MAQVQLRSNWIDILAIPVLTSIMVTQPIFIIILYLSAAATGGVLGTPFLNELTIILLALGLRWWAMGIQTYIKRGISWQNEQLLRVLGLLFAGGVIIATPLLMERSVFSMVVVSVLSLWLWWRGMRHHVLDSDIQLLDSFRFGFFALLIMLVLAVLYNDGSSGPLFAQFAQAIPLFFLSGLLAISFTRVSLIRHDYARYGTNGASGSTRNWLVALTVSWILVIIATFVFESLSFQFFITVVSILWSGTLFVLTWLVFAIAYILTPLTYLFSILFSILIHLFHMDTLHTLPTIPKQNPNTPQQQFPPEVLSAMRFFVLFVLLLLFYSVIRSLLRMLPKGRPEMDVEEVREGLSLSSLTRRSRETKAQAVSVTPPLEALEPESARAYYRELLQAVAETNPAFTRRPEETPNEYQARVLVAAQQAMVTETEAQMGEDMPTNEEIVQILTHQYSEERYGGKYLDEGRRNYLRTWIPRLISRLVRRSEL